MPQIEIESREAPSKNFPELMQPEIAPSDIKFDEYRPNASAEILNIRDDESNPMVPPNLRERNAMHMQQSTPMSFLNSGRVKSHRSNGQLP